MVATRSSISPSFQEVIGWEDVAPSILPGVGVGAPSYSVVPMPTDDEEVSPSSLFVMELSDDWMSISSPPLRSSLELEVDSHFASPEVASWSSLPTDRPRSAEEGVCPMTDGGPLQTEEPSLGPAASEGSMKEVEVPERVEADIPKAFGAGPSLESIEDMSRSLQ